VLGGGERPPFQGMDGSRTGRDKREVPVLDVYEGAFATEQAERLLWRAGFGPRPGEAGALVKKGLDGAVGSLLDPGPERLVGPSPHDDKGRPLAPFAAWGQDHSWWLDRMVRTSRPLVERMTLVWHDWFATSNEGVNSQRLMLNQNELFRRHALGSFDRLLLDVTRDPAMLLWLNGTDNMKGEPNENYAREMMELFTLGAGRGAYTERDVREQARSLTGWRSRWSRRRGTYDFHFDPAEHDDGVKQVFRQSGRFGWEDACRSCLAQPLHPAFFVTKLWSYFIPTPPSGSTLAGLEEVYRQGYEVKPVVSAILRHPDLYEGPRMVKPPVVHNAGLLRRIGAGVTTTDWAWIGQLAGQQLFYPPNVAGWDDTRWLDTATFLGRWTAAGRILREHTRNPNHPPAGEPSDPAALVDRALEFWHRPLLSEATHRHLTDFARHALGDATADWERKTYPVLVENALRQLIAVSPDLQTA
jgi:hypothetical protein